MNLLLVRNYEQAVENIHRYNVDLRRNHDLQFLLPYHTAWYYSPEYNQLGPSKFIGFIAMTGASYSIASGSIFDGGRTEQALQQFYEIIATGHPLYQKLRQQLIQLLRTYNKQPRSNFRINIPNERYFRRLEYGRKNPPWHRDELILALDLYYSLSPFPSDESHPAIISLSKLLNKLPIHPKSQKQLNFRNPNGVYMKLGNFLRLDPNYSGRGLVAGSKLDEEVWSLFANDREGLSKAATVIRQNYWRITRPSIGTEDAKPIDEDEEFPEGKIFTRLHTAKERSASASRKKKQQVLRQKGRLQCEACGFDFADFYGKSGQGFAECHHILPIGELKKEVRIKLNDLSIVCANCHRILHGVRPWLSINDLRGILRGRHKIS